MPSSARAASGSIAARKEVATCAISGAVGTFANIDPRVEDYVAEKLGLVPEPVSTQVIPRDRHAMYFATLGVDRLIGRAPGDRDPPPAAHRGAGGRGVLLARAEGLVGHAAQAQSGADREPHRPCAHGARLCAARDGERGAVARARYLAFVGRAHDRARRDGDARLRAEPPGRRDREAGRLSREHAEEPRQARRPAQFAARAAGADAGRRLARGRLSRWCSATR